MMDASSREALWNEISKPFSNGAFMQLHTSWFAGLASRAGPKRMQQLARSKPARKLEQILADLKPEEVAPLIVRSEINLDKAISALRMTLVANISVPAGSLVLANQLASQRIQSMVETTPVMALAMSIGAVLFILLGIIWYAYAGVAAARDLNHLLRLKYADTRSTALQPDDSIEEAIRAATDLA